MKTIQVMRGGRPATDEELQCAMEGKPLPPVDMVNNPPHYTSHPSGVECIQVTEHYGFCIGSAIKYLWRAGLKGDVVEDLKKSVWYINREIAKRENSTKESAQ